MHLFSAEILAEAISMTYSDMLYRLDISTFYFYKPLPFQIFGSLEIYKDVGLFFLLSLLQSTVTQITISINIFIFFLSGFCFTNIHASQDSRGRGRVSI